MRRIGFVLFILTGLLTSQAWAQDEERSFNLLERVVPHVGFVQMFPTQTVGGESGAIREIFVGSDIVSFYNFHVGAYTTLFHHKDIVSVGVDNSIQFGFRPNFRDNRLPTTYNIQVPIFVMGKLGSGATPYNQQRIGIAAGIGGSINHLKFTMFRQSDNPSVGDLEVVRTTTYVSPAAVVEISYGSLIGRLQLGLGTVGTNANDEVLLSNPAVVQEVQAFHGIFGYGLIYRF